MSKRPAPDAGSGPSSKKPRSDAVTPANGAPGPSGKSTADLIAQKKAEIAAKLAAFKKPAPSSSTPAPASSSSTPAAPISDIAARIAEAKRKVALAQSAVHANAKPSRAAPPAAEAHGPAPGTGGLKMAAHPLLLDTSAPAPQSKKDRYKPMQPKFSSVAANARTAPPPPPPSSAPAPVAALDNPYSQAAAEAAAEASDAPRARVGRSMRFAPKGKYIAQADELRREAQLEALKARIAASARKAGLDGEFDGLERRLRREPPPRAEWWDEQLLPTKNIQDVVEFAPEALIIRKEGSPVTMYVQHPIPIPAPKGSGAVMKPLMLTKKEMKKLRKRKRQEELQDKRDRVKMGLAAPDAPKVRLVNMMKVLTSDAVQDPTRVEAKVLREVAMRRHTHDKANAERKLTDEQRRAKVEEKKAGEEKKGLVGAVFKVKVLSDPAHRFKVRKNAEQMALSGLLLQSAAFSMVYVEGAAKFVRKYKTLMLSRIAWTEAARARGGDAELEDGAAEPAPKEQDDEQQAPVSLEGNRCDLVWEGPVRERAFNVFRPKLVPTDNAAREVLGPKLAGYWDTTKNFRPEDEQLGI